MFAQQQQALPLRPELVIHIFNGQYIALTNGNNSAIPPIRPPPDDTLIREVFDALGIDYTSPLGIRITYVDIALFYKDLPVYTY